MGQGQITNHDVDDDILTIDFDGNKVDVHEVAYDCLKIVEPPASNPEEEKTDNKKVTEPESDETDDIPAVGEKPVDVALDLVEPVQGAQDGEMVDIRKIING